MEKIVTAIVIENDKNKINHIKNTISELGNKIHITKFADNIENGISAIDKYHPDIIFLDVNMTDEAGNTLLDRIDKFQFDIIILDNHEFYRMIAKDSQKGGFIIKKIAISELTNL
jgi:two-component system LytT family response regulator